MTLDARTDKAKPDAGVHSYAPLPDETELRRYVVSHIDEAVEKGWIVPYFQPVIRSLSGKLCGVEALARWEDPTYGTLMPEVFIGPLELARLIHKVDCCIFTQICKIYHKNASDNLPVIPMSFNLSRYDFDLCDIFGFIEQNVRKYEVPRHMLNIEITESVFGNDSAFMLDVVKRFHNAGYQVWMDDFGSGYSTLNILKDFDFDQMKIDMGFLRNFGENSKTILASVVDMAKKLGIQTLAEGVETEEQRDFLRHIGCEKLQGYLYGKPVPYSVETIRKVIDQVGIETTTEHLYMNDLGAVKTLSISERDLMVNRSETDYATSMPYAIVEYSNDRFELLESNRIFRESLANIGVYSIEEAERRINDPRRHLARQARKAMGTIEQDKYARIDFQAGDTPCIMRVKHITTRDDKIAFLISVDDMIEQNKRLRHDQMMSALSTTYSIYEYVDIIHIEENNIEHVFDNAGFEHYATDYSFEDTPRVFAENEVFPNDRARFISFMEYSTMIQRIKESGEIFLINFFRIHQQGGDYVWKLFALILIENAEDPQIMLCMRSTHWSNDGLFQAAYADYDEELPDELPHAEMSLTDGSLWRAFASTGDMALFWKDRDRRFVGANKAFLDYYNFDSIDAIRGKTDEDMGWHVDPIPYMEEELRVLNEGLFTKNLVGHCIVQGEVRDIIATKRPVYRNGRIVGLVGSFVDIDTKGRTDGKLGNLPLIDQVTGVLNFTGLESATWRYVDSYKRLGLDFAMVSVNIESFQRINDELGYEYGDKVLRRIADELRSIAGNHRVIGHVYANRFVILAQECSPEELRKMCEDIEETLVSIAQIDGTNCTIYAFADYSLFSECGDIETMKRKNRDARAARRVDTEEL